MIGTLRESSLHASLKELYARPGDELEAIREGYVVDLVRPDELVEFQTGGFGRIRPKLEALLAHHDVRVVHPVAIERMLVRIDGDGVVTSRRRSPVRGNRLSLFDELVAIPSSPAPPADVRGRARARRGAPRRRPADAAATQAVADRRSRAGRAGRARTLELGRVLPDELGDRSRPPSSRRCSR